MVLCIAMYLEVRLFGNISSRGQHVCVYFRSFERLDGYGICQSADNGKYIKISIFAELMNLLFKEMRVNDSLFDANQTQNQSYR